MSGPHDRLLMRAAHHELDRWGKWIEEKSHYTGFASVSVIDNFGGSEGREPGHVVLMVDMPAAIWRIHHRVVRVPEISQDTLLAWYVVRVKDDGTLWTMEEKCRRLAVTPVAFRKRLQRAKEHYLRADLTSSVTSQ